MNIKKISPTGAKPPFFQQFFSRRWFQQGLARVFYMLVIMYFEMYSARHSAVRQNFSNGWISQRYEFSSLMVNTSKCAALTEIIFGQLVAYFCSQTWLHRPAFCIQWTFWNVMNRNDRFLKAWISILVRFLLHFCRSRPFVDASIFGYDLASRLLSLNVPLAPFVMLISYWRDSQVFMVAPIFTWVTSILSRDRALS